ncbi:PREDICTED: uncharacterized protein LOC108552635 [Eufriesea mexicana]|uniref:uncharacterized protein LOC108552635 n=1 Tax=Eufriesea mexicana TaxID=516756 RepID=UPI00083BB171|nr:PREDICTED: uncharacterized protein LOC108552635 [Eufriesea mexicana]
MIVTRHQCSSSKNGFSSIRSLFPRTKQLSFAEIVSLNTCMVQQQCKGESYYNKQYFTSSGHLFKQSMTSLLKCFSIYIFIVFSVLSNCILAISSLKISWDCY